MDNRLAIRSDYTGGRPERRSRSRPALETDETDLSAKCAPAEEEARLPRQDVDPRRPVDPEAPPRKGPQAPLRLGATRVQRKNRLSRSRDFDAVYRHGRSASTRFLTLYWFARPEEPGEPRLGLAVPKAAGNSVVRNRIKRQLREIWRASSTGSRSRRSTTTSSSSGRDCPRRRRHVGTTGSSSGSTRCSGRWPRDDRPAPLRPGPARDGARLRLPLHLRTARSARAPASTTRAARSTRSTRCASTASSRARRRRSGGCCAATRGRTAGSTTHDRRRGTPLQHPAAARERGPLAARPLPHDRAARGPGRSSRRRSSCGSCSCR